jgi:FkbM family methyltransferase
VLAASPLTQETPRRDGLAVACGRLGWVPADVATYLGKPFVFPAGSDIGKGIGQGYEWDRVLRPLAQILLLETEPVVCEVGGNIGASSLQILAGKPDAQLLVFEPSERFRPFLEQNLNLAGFPNVQVTPYALGSKRADFVEIFNNLTSGSAIPGGHYLERQTVPMTTLDEVFADSDRLAFLKVDTDGYDFEVLRGGEATLRRDRPVVFFELAPTLLRTGLEEELAWLRAQGYAALVALHPGGAPLGPLEGADSVLGWTGKYDYCDVLAVPDGLLSPEKLTALLVALATVAVPSTVDEPALA